MTTRVYDLPTRLFHWIFAASFLTAFTIANTVDDDATAFSFHMIAGLIMCFAVVLRIVWGVIGSRYARFSAQCPVKWPSYTTTTPLLVYRHCRVFWRLELGLGVYVALVSFLYAFV